jgi:hypothetical protein
MKTWQKIVLAMACSGCVGVGIGAGMALADHQPHMKTALTALQNAQGELQIADDDKGGYRAAAIKDVADAIANVQSGIDWANNH